MKAVLASPALIDTDLPEPTPGPHDLLVHMEAVAVNPVDLRVCGKTI
jgi:NADPH:quinone reductase-like Zn-dependent oxidoreductase